MKNDWKSFALQLIDGGFACPTEMGEEIYKNSLLINSEVALFLTKGQCGKSLVMIERKENSLFADIVAAETGNFHGVIIKSPNYPTRTQWSCGGILPL